MKTVRWLVVHVPLALTLLCPATGFGQTDGATADMRVVVLKAQASSLTFEQYGTAESVRSNVPTARRSANTKGEVIRSIASDGDQWFSISHVNGSNCFTRYSSYENLVEGRALRRACNTTVIGDGYRGLAHDGRFFYTLFWDGRQHWWQSYASWNDVISNKHSGSQTSNRNGDIYKGIAFDPTKRIFLSLAQANSQVWLLKYATFTDMVTVKALAGGTYNFSSSEPYAGMAIGPVNPTLDVYLVAGQSNAVGWRTDGAQLATHPADSQIRFFYRIGEGMNQSPSTSVEVTTLRPQTAAFRTQPPVPTNFGIEMGSGRSLYDAGRRNMAIVKVAFGGTNLYSQWSSLNNDGLFKLLQENLSMASTQWNGQGYRTRIVGLFWMQGEFDAIDELANASAYGTNFKAFVGAVRSMAGDACLPVVLGRISTFWGPNGWAVRDAQVKFAAGDECARWVDTDDLTVYPGDAAHFDNAGEYLLGQRMGAAYKAISGW